jgi:peptidoglycan hydrolase-like protein with peptidoglycan-binding domain
MLKFGDNNSDVTLLQHRLTHLGYTVTINGNFDADTLTAVHQLQRDKGLVIDGLVGNKTISALLKRDIRHLLSQQDINNAAALLDVDAASIMALKSVESRGNGFLNDGRVVILYERHVMRKRLRANGYTVAQVANLQNKYPNLVNAKTGGYRGYSAEHYRLQLAASIHNNSALESCSWGLFQIMGYHWERLGYSSITDFVGAMRANEGNQLHAFVQFIKTDKKLHSALTNADWATVARLYNGPAYKKNNYDTRLQNAYTQFNNTEGAPWE